MAKILPTLVASLLVGILLSMPGHAEPVTITYMGWGNPQEKKISEDLLASFEKTHPHIKVRYIHTSDFESKLRTMMAGDIAPDVFYMPAESFEIYARKNTLLDLDPLIRETKFDVADFFPQVLKAFIYQGKHYGIPKDFTTQVMYYNKDLFDKAGVPYPTRDWTWSDMLSAARKMTLDFNNDGRIDQFGLQFSSGLVGVYGFSRQAGGDFFVTDEQGTPRKSTINSPEVLKALTFLRDLNFKDEVVLSSATGAGRDAQTEFSNGRLAMLLGYGRWLTPRFREMNKFRWDAAEMPREKERFSIIYTVAYSISAKTKHPKEAFELLSYLTGPVGQALNSDLGLAIPAIRSVAYSDHFINPKGDVDDRAFLRTIEYAEVIPRTPNPEEFNEICNPYWEQVLTLNTMQPADALKQMDPKVNAFLEKWRTLRSYPKVNWTLVLSILAVLLTIAVGVIVWFFRRSGPIGRLARQEERTGYMFIAPWILGVLLFGLFPIFTSLFLSLCEWDAITPLSNVRWLGFANYARAFTVEPKFWIALRVTAIYSIVSVPIGLVLSVAIAMLLNQKVKGIPLFRTLYYLPSLVGGVSVAVLWWRIFNRDFGLLNYALLRMGLYDLWNMKPIDWLGHETWALPAMIIMSLWGVGGGMLIYLAGLQGIPTQMYEAASIDGAGKITQFFKITLPMLSAVIFFNLIMGIIGSFQVFTQAFVMTSGGPNNATLFYVLYLFQKGFQQFEMGYASALAWVLFAIVLVLTAFVMKSSKSWVYYEGGKD
ncbi:MAG: extracellular solute-binding protein [Armatimonadetes bacterium]|nr:extracellular solute-binding protein [Armatimonadota bacterium]